ncbi:cytochrome P450 [Salipiger sp. IMCC34102]|uniref:cytochrome P450 n=1 Tax=Salipiger sp. IMCC34102 TaxID=2510647 RepID=UPI00101E0D7D|nr:cytochrome P450 [Salipiger sp. IMCC34102]RYH02123.1 cytochrome P450 [Salipiger sp. IMCC34102]
MNDPANRAASGCPMSAASRQFEPFEHRGMYDFLASIREDVPIFHAEQIDYWVVTQRDDIEAIMPDSERFSAAIATQPIFPWPETVGALLKDRDFTNEAVQVACDPPRHTRVKGSATKFLNIRQFMGYEDRLRDLVRGYIEKMKGQETVDLVEAITYEFPAQVVFLLLGVTDFDPRKIKAWGDLRLHMIWGNPDEHDLVQGASDLADFWDYTVELVKARKHAPQDDYPSLLFEIRDGDDEILTENEIRSLVFGLLLAGHETTTNAAGNIILELMRHPDQWKAIVEDPGLAKNAVEEGLRYASSVVAWRRQTKEPVTIGGVDLPAGANLLLSLASANRDPAKFDAPDTFDITRSNAREHMAFGKGLHHCLGAPLARLELRILLEELSAAFPRMELAEDNMVFTRTLSFRGPSRLPVRLNEDR